MLLLVATSGVAYGGLTTSPEKSIVINEYNSGGEIIGSGPSTEKNVLTAMAISDDSKQDNESFTVTIKNLTNIQTIHLEYKIEDTKIAQFDAIEPQNHTCNINVTPGESTVQCIVNVTPLQTGNTKISFTDGNNYWTDLQGNKSYYESTQLQDVKVNIGSLYVGYDSGFVFRKGSTPIDLTPTTNIGVRSLAVDGPNHRLFAISGNGIYKQNDFSNTSLNLVLESSLPNQGSLSQNLQTLSLTNESDTILLGTSTKKVLAFKPSDNSYTVESIFKGSIIGIATDTEQTNLNYVVDSLNNFAVRDQDNNWIFNTDKDIVKKLDNLQVTAFNGEVYVSASLPPTTTTSKDGGSELLTWQSGKLIKVITTNSPFVDGNYIVSLFNNKNMLFASSSDGELYRLNRLNNQWEQIATLLRISAITDIAVDKNSNIYLATGASGVYKIKADDLNNTNLLKNYSASTLGGSRTLVIDNNLQ